MRVFISHSSKDKDHARRLATDLCEVGHDVFFDEWDIKAGQCILTAIQEGIRQCDFMVLLLTTNSVSSRWVEQEWKAKYWTAVESGTLAVIPALFSECDIPLLLKSIKYADFRKSYLSGLRELNSGLGGQEYFSVPSTKLPIASSGVDAAGAASEDPLDFLAELADRSAPLSRTLPKLIRFARVRGLGELEDVCRQYLLGDTAAGADGGKFEDMPEFRRVYFFDVYVGLRGEINPRYSGWGSTDAMFEYVKNCGDFKWFRLGFTWSIVDLEAREASSQSDRIGYAKIPASKLIQNADNPEREFTGYFSTDAWSRILLGMRRHLSRMISDATRSDAKPADVAISAAHSKQV